MYENIQLSAGSGSGSGSGPGSDRSSQSTSEPLQTAALRGRQVGFLVKRDNNAGQRTEDRGLVLETGRSRTAVFLLHQRLLNGQGRASLCTLKAEGKAVQASRQAPGRSGAASS